MSITLVSAPEADIQGNAANKSYWSAVHHKFIWNLLRMDFSVHSLLGIGDPTSYIRFSTGAPTPTQLAEAVQGDYIYYESTDGTVSGVFEIISVGANYIEITYVYNGTLVGGFLNYTSARTNHYIEVVVLEVTPVIVAGDYATEDIGALKIVCSPSGRASVNMMEYLKSLVDYKETFAHDGKHWRDATLGGLSSIKFRESYGTTVTSYQAVQFLGLGSYVNAAKQVHDVYGINMADFVTSLLYTGAKFMSDFATPTYFSGLPFSLTCILSEHLFPTPESDDSTITGLSIIETFKTINNGTIASFDTTIFDATDVAGVYRVMLSNDTDIPVIPATTKTIDVHLDANDGTVITETKTVKYNDVCEYANPIYLNWLGTNGGRNYWLFDQVQSDLLEVIDTGEFTPQIDDLETDLGNGEYLGKEASPQLICKAYLELSDIRGLKGLLMSPDVLMMTNNDTWQTDNPTSPPSPLPKWKRVKVLPQTYKVLETNATHAEIEITLLLPNINIQTQ